MHMGINTLMTTRTCQTFCQLIDTKRISNSLPSPVKAMTCMIPAADSFGLKGERAAAKTPPLSHFRRASRSVGCAYNGGRRGRERVRPKLSMIAYSVSTAAAAAAGVACNGERELGSGRPSLFLPSPSSSCSLACSLPVHYRNDQAALRGSLAENSLAACTTDRKRAKISQKMQERKGQKKPDPLPMQCLKCTSSAESRRLSPNIPFSSTK